MWVKVLVGRVLAILNETLPFTQGIGTKESGHTVIKSQ